MVIGSTSSGGQFHGSSVDSFGQTIKSSSNSPLFGTSTPFGSPIGGPSVFPEKGSSQFGSNSSQFGGSTFLIQTQGNALQQSNSSFGPLPPSQSHFASIGGLAFGTATGNRNFDQDARNPAPGASSTIFGVPNSSGIGFKSTPRVLDSNSAHGTTSSIFGVSNQPRFTSRNGSNGSSTSIFGIPSTSFFQGSNASAFQVSTTSIFGGRPTPSLWSTSAPNWSSLSEDRSTFAVGAPSTSNFSNSTSSGFHLGSTSASDNRNIFGIHSSSGSQGATTLGSTVRNQVQGSGVAPYSATQEVNGANNRHSVEKIQSISRMPVYNKSHEELRSEDYQLCKEGGQTTWGGQSSGSACFKSYDKPANISPFRPSSNHSSVNSLFSPFKSNLSTPKSQAFNNPNSTIATVPPLGSSVNSFSPTNLHPFQKAQDFIPQDTAVSSMAAFTPNLYPSSPIPFSGRSKPKNDSQCPAISTTFISPSFTTFSSSKPSSTVSPSIQSTAVTASGPWPSIFNASQPGETSDKVNSLSTNSLSQPSQTSNDLTMVTEVRSQNINGQQYVSSSTVEMQSSLVVNPFAEESAMDRSNAGTSIQYGISSIPVSNKLSPDKKTSMFRIRHLSSRHLRLPALRHNSRSSEPKVPFFSDKEDILPGPIAPFMPRENPRAWVMPSLLSRQENAPLHSYAEGQGCEDKARPGSSFRLKVNPIRVTDDASVQEEDLSALENCHQDDDADILAQMPKLPDGGYYIEPPTEELAAKERAEPGFCSRVNEFVVGRKGYGSIKFVGETDVCHLDLDSIIQFNNREVIVYADGKKKPPIGAGLNKPAEVTLLNVKCISKKTGKHCVDGPRVHSFKEMLISKAEEQGAEFVSYDPVQGEWKFRVKHF